MLKVEIHIGQFEVPRSIKLHYSGHDATRIQFDSIVGENTLILQTIRHLNTRLRNTVSLYSIQANFHIVLEYNSIKQCKLLVALKNPLPRNGSVF